MPDYDDLFAERNSFGASFRNRRGSASAARDLVSLSLRPALRRSLTISAVRLARTYGLDKSRSKERPSFFMAFATRHMSISPLRVRSRSLSSFPRHVSRDLATAWRRTKSSIISHGQ